MAGTELQKARAGIYHWQAEHPAWVSDEGWDKLVTSYALDDGEQLVIVDPITPPQDLIQLATERETTIVLTCPWHERDAAQLSATLELPVYSPPPDGVARKLGDSATVFRAGDRLPCGLDALTGMEDSDLVLWSAHHRALIAGDTLVARGEGLAFPTDWVDSERDAAAIKQGLLPLLELDVELVLPTHGLPTDRAALARALA